MTYIELILIIVFGFITGYGVQKENKCITIGGAVGITASLLHWLSLS